MVFTDFQKFSLIKLAVTIVFTAFVLWGVSDLMRESDQASVIDGAVQLARDGGIVGRDFYNYDLLFGAYWVLAFIYKLLGLDIIGTSFDDLVRVGNWVAAVTFLLGAISLLWSTGPSKWWKWLVLVCCLISPVILYSIPLLSPAIMSAGFLLLLGVVMTKRGSLGGDALAFFLAFAAIAMRADAVLAMPFFAFLSNKEETIVGLVKDRRVWAAALGSLIAIVVGSLIFPLSSHEPSRFFNGLLFSSYVVFGLNGGVWLLLLTFGGLLWRWYQRRSMFSFLLAISFMIPMCYYTSVFFSPRYLIIPVVLMLVTCAMERGQEMWAGFVKLKIVRCALIFAAVHSVLALFVGLGMDSLKNGRLVVQYPTVFPTADGFWPMGANLSFYKRLAQAGDHPIDHNQRVWSAWKSIDAGGVSDDQKVRIESNGFISYGKLWLTVTGKTYAKPSDSVDLVLVDGRSVVKTQGSHRGKPKSNKTWIIQESEKVGSAYADHYGEGIYLLSKNQISINEQWAILSMLGGYVGGNDYLVMKPWSNWADFYDSGPFKWLIIVPKGVDPMLGEHLSVSKVDLIGGGENSEGKIDVYSFKTLRMSPLPDFSKLPDGAWVARSSLPAFMNRNAYQK